MLRRINITAALKKGHRKFRRKQDRRYSDPKARNGLRDNRQKFQKIEILQKIYQKNSSMNCQKICLVKERLNETKSLQIYKGQWGSLVLH